MRSAVSKLVPVRAVPSMPAEHPHSLGAGVETNGAENIRGAAPGALDCVSGSPIRVVRCALHIQEESLTRFVTKMLMYVRFPVGPFNAAVRDGSAGPKIQRILEAIKSEAAYFTSAKGGRGGLDTLGPDWG